MAINIARAHRRTDISSSVQTSEHVGPGTYSNTHNEPVAPPGEAPIPFNSLQEKVLNQNRGTSAITPGPGTYVGTKGVHRNGGKDYGEDNAGIGPTAFKSKSARLGPTAPGSTVYTPSTIEKNPGPGTYPNAGHQNLGRARSKDARGPVKPVLEVMEKSMPSIPLMKLLPGQAPENEDSAVDVANVVMRHTGDRGDTAGPGEYDMKTAIVARTERTTAFHMSKLTRSLWEPSVAINNLLPPRENPGPGAYEKRGMSEAIVPKAEEGELVNTYQFSSKSAMAHQVEVPTERVQPGPGQYETPGDIDRGARSARDRSTQRGGATQFGSMTERTSTLNRLGNQPYKDPYSMRNVPGPGHYTEAQSAFPVDPKKKEAEKAMPDARRKKIHGVHHPSIVIALSEAQGPLQAFNCTDDRPCNKTSDARTPAPWQYNKDTARGHSMAAELREKAKVGRRGAFGTCADRFYGSPLDGKQGLPDPGMEAGSEGGMGATSGANSEPRAVFQSSSNRFHSAPGPREDQAIKLGSADTPAPGSYMVEKEPNYRSPFRQPRADHLSFGSGKTRFDATKVAEDVFSGHMMGLQNPGPGVYNNVPPVKSRAGGVGMAKASRREVKVGSTTTTVGPGSYGDIDTQLLKKTYNVTMAQAPVSAMASEMSRGMGS